MDDARTAAAARAMDVEERDPVAFAKGGTVQCAYGSPDRLQRSSRHVTGNDGIRDSAQASVPEVDVGAADLRARRPQEGASRRKLGDRKLSDFDRLTWGGHHGRQDAIAHSRTLPLNQFRFLPLPSMIHQDVLRGALVLLALATLAVPAAAQTYSPERPRRQFFTVSIDWLNTEPLHFDSHPVEDLVGRDVATSHGEAHDYHTRDEQIFISVREFRRRNRAVSLAVYPFGLSSGTTLGIRGSIEQLPTIRIGFTGPEAPQDYALVDARAYDIGAGLFIADRSPGWGLGSQAFIVAGVGRIKADEREGSRLFAEGGGGLSVGPFGVQLAVKFAWNRLTEPVEHRFFTVPITLRGTLSF